MYIERQQLVEELRLRKLIQQAIRIVENKKTITEDEVADTNRAPYDNTGLNTLNTLFDNILKQIEQGYKELTTSKEQRNSFSAHILKAVENTLAPLRALDKTDQALEEEIDVNIGQDTPEEMADVRMTDDEKAKEDFTIEDEDLSGRDKAYETFNKVETQIVDAYKTLHDPNDIKSFYDGLLMNLDLYFQKFEDEMAPTVDKPDTGADVEAGLDSQVNLDDPGEDIDLEDIADL